MFEPSELEPERGRRLGGYSTQQVIFGVGWALGLVAILFAGRKRRVQAPPPAIAASAEPAAEPRHSNEQQQQQRESHAQGVSGRLPHAKSVQHSLARLFSSGVNTGSDGNLEGLAAASATAAKLATTTQGKLQPGQVVEGAGSPNSGSPRSVIGGRAFSLSNLFGLASGW